MTHHLLRVELLRDGPAGHDGLKPILQKQPPIVRNLHAQQRVSHADVTRAMALRAMTG